MLPFRRTFPARIISAVFALGLLFFSACEPGESTFQSAEIDEPNYRLGQRLMRQGRHQEALAAYLRVVALRGDAAPESHLEVGIIYLQHIKDPITAIYHFKKYLERSPNALQATQVRGLVESAKREFARTLPANPLENQSERLDLLEQINRLQRENETLQMELLQLARNAAEQPAPLNQVRVPTDNVILVPERDTRRARESVSSRETSPLSLAPMAVSGTGPDAAGAGVAAVAPTRPATSDLSISARAPLPQASRRHVVVRGDTLFGLAQRYYNDRRRWREIYQANRDILPDENSLAVGMELRIP